ncbi:2-C-methyl-D-erythritol 2,4-cyclodiphosphate synthase [Candidatus Peregrinibacteria bacterium]|jgi:2-C-methyl-D-erythritol 4-phosphate cytidylyltransferase / 2-C-methyl-D-erythritol 2,4-cyclodiphosphate synthase|nr:2-C-methyl-D-erythritol 2,4-cyclodiphosphate synthase [Candidatus Peregrinibacteria bacterium]
MISSIIVAAGKSERFGKNKLRAILGGLPVLMRTLFAFQTHPEVDEIILVVNKEKINEMKVLEKPFSKIKKIISGEQHREQSSAAGVIESAGDICIVHNGANPLVSQKEISDVIQSVTDNDAAFVGRKVSATLKHCKKDKVDKTIDRTELVEAETPQGFKKELYLKALESIQDSHKTPELIFTDEMQVLESIGVHGKYIEASPQNRKITTLYDLQIAESFLKPHTRTGLGHDSHRFSPTISDSPSVIPALVKPAQAPAGIHNRETYITLGGVKIPHSKSFDANSDGDVLVHALCNAIGTAIGEGSLSKYADEMCKRGVKDSMKYLDHIKKNMQSMGYSVGNISASIEGKEPKLEIHIPEMKKKIASILDINPFQIGVACTSGEELTSFGKGEGMQCFCSVQLVKV